MNIKLRLSIQFTLIIAGILLFFSLFVYYFSYTSQLNKFRENLFDNARNNAILLINVEEVDSSLLKKIHQSTVLRDNEEILITDSVFIPLYSNNNKLLTAEKIRENHTQTEKNFFSAGIKDGVCYRHIYHHRTFYVYILAYDKSRVENLKELREILSWSTVFSLWFSVLFSYIFSGRALKPISRIIGSVKEINSLRLYKRLDEGKGKDEIEQLAVTFNKMLTDLEIAFRNQEEFVLNASHEMRTPISIMIGESDYVLSKERDKVMYEEHIKSLISDLKKINLLLNSLLEIAQISNHKKISFSNVRIDEILFNAIFQLKEKYPEMKIIPRINYTDSDEDLIISGNAGLLEIAVKNLLDNACKFSGKDVIADLLIEEKDIEIIITDQGIGIPQAEINRIFNPFHRASNAKYIGGFGVGLSLVNKILELHNTVIKIESVENSGTRILLYFNKIDH
jgi:signal transduction histidine kinase